MIKSVYINNKLYEINNSLVHKDVATEELDSCTFQILNSSKIQLEPMQKVVVEFVNDTRKYFILNTWVEEVATFDTNLKNYIISCSSETKKLERVQLPTLTITQPLDSSLRKKYSHYVNSVFNIYIKPMYPDLTIDSALIEELDNQIAVEETFNNLNAKDFFNTILEKTMKLVVVENNVIKALPIDQKKNAINTSNLFFTTSEEKIEDYYSKIRADVQGVQSDSPTVITEVVGMRAPENAILTTENAIIKLSHNINYIEKVVVYLHATIGNHQNQYIKATINNKSRKTIVEKSEYDLYKVSNVTNLFDDDLKRMHLYYVRGSNTIEGFNYDEGKLLDDLVGKTPLYNVIANMLAEQGSFVDFNTFDDIRKVKFEVTYSALDDVSVSFEKDKTFNSEIRDNQSESYIDLDKFAKNEQVKINRLGNPTMPIMARYDNIEDVPELFDYIDDYILAEREIAYHSEYIDFKGVLYKDYINRDIFYGVNAKKRTTPLLSGSEAVTRKDLTKLKYVFEFNDTSSDKSTQRYLLGRIAATNYYGDGMLDYDTLSMSKDDFRSIEFAVGTSTFYNGQTTRYKLEPDVRKANNSATINFKFYDNINVGIKHGGIKIGGYSQEYVTYTDNLGELKKLKIELYDKTNLSEIYEDSSNNTFRYFGLSKENFDKVDSFPSIPDGILIADRKFLALEVERNKDGKEILNETIQIEIDGSEDIFVNDNVIDTLPLLDKSKKHLYIWISTNERYNKFNKDKVVSSAIRIDKEYNSEGVLIKALQVDYTDFQQFIQNKVLFNRIMLYNKNVDLTNVKSWALADGAGEVIIAVNKRDTDVEIPTIIYLNRKEN